jgi:hypothetical protein
VSRRRVAGPHNSPAPLAWKSFRMT